MSLKDLIAKTRNTRDYENLESRLGKKLGSLLYKVVDEADKADKELDIVHSCLTELYNELYNDDGYSAKIKKALDDIELLYKAKPTS